MVAALACVLVALLRLQSCFATGWAGRTPTTRMCPSDLATAVGADNLGRGLAAYLSGDLDVRQPPLTAALMSLIGGFTDAPTLLTAQRALVITWAVLAVVLLGLMAFRVATVPGADPTQVVLSPVAALTVLVSPDLLGVALATLGLVAWLRRRAALAGVLLGLAVMARTYPLVLLAVMVAVVLVRDPQRRPDLRPLALGALGGVVAVALPLAWHPGTIISAWRAWWAAGTSLGSPWHVPSLVGTGVPDPLAVALSVLGWVAAAFVVALLLTRRGPAPSLAGLALVAVAIVLVTGTAAPPGASLWLVPLAALAGVRWRDHLVWAACEGAYFVAHWLFVNGLVEHTKGLPAGWYAVFLLVRLAGIAWLARAAVPSISGRHAPTGTLDRLPSACGKPPPVVGDAAYPPVTEGP